MNGGDADGCRASLNFELENMVAIWLLAKDIGQALSKRRRAQFRILANRIFRSFYATIMIVAVVKYECCGTDNAYIFEYLLFHPVTMHNCMYV